MRSCELETVSVRYSSGDSALQNDEDAALAALYQSRTQSANRRSVTQKHAQYIETSAQGWSELTRRCSAIAILTAPLLMNPWGFDRFQLPHLTLVTIAVMVGVSAIAVEGFRLARPLIPLAAFLGAATLAALVSRAPTVSFFGTDTRRFGVVGWLLLAGAFIIGLAMNAKTDRFLLLRAVPLVSVPMALYAIAERAGFDPFDTGSPAFRPESTVGNAAFLGAYLAVALVLAAGAAVYDRHRWWWIGIALLDAVALALTGSRGAWVGAAVGLLCIGVTSVQRLGRRATVAMTVGATASVTALVVFLPGVADRASSVVRVGEGTAGARLVLAKVGLRAVADRPLFGWGPDISRPALHQFIPRSFETLYRDERIEDRAHNALIDITVWTGIIGAALFIWFVVSVVRAVRGSERDWTRNVVGIAVLAFAVHLLFNFPVPEIDATVWLLLGSTVPTARRLPPAPVGLVAPIAAVSLAAYSLSAATQFSADRAVKIGADHEQRGDVTAALFEYQSAMRTSGGKALYSEVVARAALRQGQTALAIDAARQLVAADPSDPFGHELLASALNTDALQTGQRESAEEAERILQPLILDSPFDGSLHLELGNSYAARGRAAEAAKEYELATDLTPARSDAWRNRAILAERSGRTEDAKDYYAVALYLDPADALSRAGLERSSPPSTTTSP